MNSRGVAANIISEWLETEMFPDRLIGDDVRDRAFVMEVVYGVVRRKRALEWMIRKCSDRRPDAIVLPFLLVGAYQLVLMDNVETYAAVNETVEAVKESSPSAGGFVNAVLRKIQSRKDALSSELKTRPVGIRESHPDILVEKWTRSFGEKKTDILCEWNNTRPEVIIHVDRQKISCEEFLAMLKVDGIEVVPHPYAEEEAFILPKGARIAKLPGFKEGLFSVQDPATLLSVGMLDPQPGERVLDACAAPGGKTILMAERMQGKGRIVAVDLHSDRIKTLRQNIKRMKLDMTEVVQANMADEQQLSAAGGGDLFDRVLLDVPCSNTGVLRRRPDARWRFASTRLRDLNRTQSSLLYSSSRLVKPGGLVVYSTCSLEEEENQRLVESWLKKNPLFELTETAELFPPETRTDGAYAAAIRKKE